MSGRSVAFFAMPQEGHFHNLVPLISGLTGAGLEAQVLTDRAFRPHVERAGGTFVDVFGRYPLEAADDESHPFPCRFVSYAGRYAAEIANDLAEIGPSLVVYDEHAVVGRVVARSLAIPGVSVAPAHNVSPERLPALVRSLPGVRISAGCAEAVAVLRDRHGIADASPFMFASGLSPNLNVYGEPQAFLTDEQRQAFEPVAFYGCLPASPHSEPERPGRGAARFDGDASGLQLFVSFGTVAWRYWPGEALAAAAAISRSAAELPDLRALISLGGAELPAAEVRALERPNVAVAAFVDQWSVLAEADAFVTHNGLRSTHEAIYNRVPMISYPFFWDQPALAERCRQLGLAVPLTDGPRDPIGDSDLPRALDALARGAGAMRERLAEAGGWERELIAGRAAVVRRITELIAD